MALSEWIPGPIKRHPRLSVGTAGVLGLLLLLKECPDAESVKPETASAPAAIPDKPAEDLTDERVRDFLRSILGGDLVQEEQPAEEPKEGLEICRQVIEQNNDILCTPETDAHMSCIYTGDDSPHLPVQIMDQSKITDAVRRFVFRWEERSGQSEDDLEVYVGPINELFNLEEADFQYPIPKAGDEDRSTCEAIRDILYNPMEYADLLCEGKENCDPETELGKYHHGLDFALTVDAFAQDLNSVGLPFSQEGLNFKVELPQGECELTPSVGMILFSGEYVYQMSSTDECPPGIRGFTFNPPDMTEHLLTGGEAFEAFDPPEDL